MPKWISAQYETADGNVHPLELSKPLIIENERAVSLDLVLRTTRLSHPAFYIIPQNCLESITVDDVPVTGPNIPFCYWIKRETKMSDSTKSYTQVRNWEIALDRSIPAGEHHIRLQITNDKKDVGARIQQIPGGLLWLHLLFIALFLRYGWVLMRSVLPRLGISPLLGYTMLSGVFLRMFYFSITSFSERSYDTNGHIDYIMYVVKHWMIPAADKGWEYHQQPLYYFISASWMHIAGLFGRSFQAQLNDVRLFSLLCSIGIFFLGIWIGKLLFCKEGDKKKLFMYAGFLATLPGLIFLSSRITNDSLSLLLAFLIFGLLLRWWKQGFVRDWYLLSFVLGIGILTKLTLLSMLAVVGCCLIFIRHHTLTQKTRMAIVSLIVLTVLLGNVAALRISQKQEAYFSSHMNRHLVLGNSSSNFLTFWPPRVVMRPFNDNWRDGWSRQFFWENFLKSVFFGEWKFISTIGFLGSYIMLLVCLLIPFFVVGGWTSIRNNAYATLPIWLTFFGLLSSLLAYRFTHPYSSNQDFRYIALIAVPVAYYIAHGIENAPPSLRFIGRLLAYVLMSLCVLFIALLAIHA